MAAGIGTTASPAHAAAVGCPDPGGATPVVYVHGLNSKPADFTDHGKPTIPDRIAAIPHTAVIAFDYQQVADRWVDNADSGPRLAQYISCLGDTSARNGGTGKVIVIAHSMGGLAIRYAAHLDIGGHPTSDRIGLIVTVGTPNTGSWIEGLLTGGPKALPAGGVIGLLYRSLSLSCTVGEPVAALAGVCGFLKGPGEEASLAMRPGSPQLLALPDPPASVPLAEVAGRIQVVAHFFLGPTVTLTSGIGDLLVKPDSALAYRSRTGVTALQDDCEQTIAALVINQGWSACTHGGLLYDSASQDFVESQVRSWIQSHLPQPTPPCRRDAVDLSAAPTLDSAPLHPAAYDHMMCAKDFALLYAGPDPFGTTTEPTLFLRRHGATWQLRSIGYPADNPFDIYLGIFADDCRQLGLDKIGMTCRIPRGARPTLTPLTHVTTAGVTLPDGRILPFAADAVLETFDGRLFKSAADFVADYEQWVVGPDTNNPRRVALLWVKDNTITAISLLGTIDAAAAS